MAYTLYESAHILYQHWRELVDMNSTMVKTEHDICMEQPVYWGNQSHISQGEESADMEVTIAPFSRACDLPATDSQLEGWQGGN